jgi:hypothetical protein
MWLIPCHLLCFAVWSQTINVCGQVWKTIIFIVFNRLETNYLLLCLKLLPNTYVQEFVVYRARQLDSVRFVRTLPGSALAVVSRQRLITTMVYFRHILIQYTWKISQFWKEQCNFFEIQCKFHWLFRLSDSLKIFYLFINFTSLPLLKSFKDIN